MTKQEQYDLATTDAFKARVKIAGSKAAGNIYNPDTHSAQEIAKSVISNPHGDWLDALVYAVVNHPEITGADVTDDKLQNVVDYELSVIGKAKQ